LTGLQNQLLQIQLSTATLTRKQSNFGLSEQLLIHQITTLLKDHTENGCVTIKNELLPALTSLRTTDCGVNQLDILKVQREGAKLLHAIGQNKEAIDVLSSSVVFSNKSVLKLAKRLLILYLLVAKRTVLYFIEKEISRNYMLLG